ncbi:MAG: hypothetical protein RLZZ626_388 [Actinomycetota bacterium]|jgi:hypothetical protein
MPLAQPVRLERQVLRRPVQPGLAQPVQVQQELRRPVLLVQRPEPLLPERQVLAQRVLQVRP